MRWPLSEQVGTVPMDLCEKWTGALDSSTHVPSGFYTAVPHLPVLLRLE